MLVGQPGHRREDAHARRRQLGVDGGSHRDDCSGLPAKLSGHEVPRGSRNLSICPAVVRRLSGGNMNMTQAEFTAVSAKSVTATDPGEPETMSTVISKDG